MLFVTISAMLLMQGCGNKAEGSDSQAEVTLTYKDTGVAATPSQADIVFLPGETAPIMKDGGVYGSIKINWVQRLGIWDFNNHVAVTNGVKESYTINMVVDMSSNVDVGESLVVYVTPEIIVDGSNAGNKCCVGWSGFPETAQLFDNDKDVIIEVGVQPEVLDLTNAQVRLDISDSNGVVYDSVTLGNEFLAGSAPGPSLITDGEVTVHSINGAEFTVGVGSVYYEQHVVGEEQSDDVRNFYDFVYSLRYDMLPTNGREVTFFDSSNNFNIPGKLACYLTSDVDDNKLYDSNSDALRLKYSNNTDVFPYVTETFVNVPVGKTATAQLNRESTCGAAIPEYVRVCFEFPEELDARSMEEIMQFDGRFLVFQQKIGERELEFYDAFQEYD